MFLRYNGDLCPIDVESIDDAEDLGTCLTLKVLIFPRRLVVPTYYIFIHNIQNFTQDGGMAKLFVKNSTTGENEFSVSVNIFRN